MPPVSLTNALQQVTRSPRRGSKGSVLESPRPPPPPPPSLSPERVAKLEIDRRTLLRFILTRALAEGKVRLPPDATLEDVDWPRVDASFTVDCLNHGKDVIIPLAWLVRPAEPRECAGPDDDAFGSLRGARLSESPVRGRGSSTRSSAAPLAKLTKSSSIRSMLSTAGGASSGPLPPASGPPPLPPRSRSGSRALESAGATATDISHVLSVTSTSRVSPHPPTLELAALSDPINGSAGSGGAMDLGFGLTPDGCCDPESAVTVQSDPADEPAGYALRTFWPLVRSQLAAASHETDWRYAADTAASPWAPDHALAAYELASFLVVDAPAATQDVLVSHVRVELEVSMRKHHAARAALAAISQENWVSPATFRLALLFADQASPDLALGGDDAPAWRARQAAALLDSVKWSLPASPVPPPEWTAFAAAVAEGRYTDAVSLLPTPSHPPAANPALLALHARLVTACIDPDAPWRLVSCTADVLARTAAALGTTKPTDDAVRGFALYAFTYLRSGSPRALEAAHQVLARARREGEAAVGLWPVIQAHARAALEDVHAWPADRAGDFPWVAGVLALTSLADPPPPPVPVTTAGKLATAVAVGAPFPPRVQAWVRDAVATSKRRQETKNAIPPPSASPLTQQQPGQSLEALRTHVQVWLAQLRVDTEVLWPAMRHVMPPADWWAAVAVVAANHLTANVIARVARGPRPDMGRAVLDLMASLNDVDRVLREVHAKVAPPGCPRIALPLHAAFEPAVRHWLGRQLAAFLGVVDRAVLAETWTEAAADGAFHTDAAVTVLAFANSYARAVLALPLPSLVDTCVPHLVLDVQTAVHHFQERCAGAVSGAESVGELALRLGNLLHAEHEWRVLRASIRKRARALSRAAGTKVAQFRGWSVLGSRSLVPSLLPPLARAVAAAIAREFPWPGTYLPVARAAPLADAVVPALLGAADALADVVHPAALSHVAAELAAAAVDAFLATVWAKPRAYIETDYDDVLEPDLDALRAALKRVMDLPGVDKAPPRVLAVAKDAAERLEAARTEMAALMPLASRDLVAWLEDPPTDEGGGGGGLASPDRIARVLVCRVDVVAKAAVKKFRLDGGRKGK
ncbi:hypothetical protein H9P43_003851 [Blastocladiella emersonii ATCC 22665]|nr:hypothetical protein H9P43_003851 [Blastocladiella emersonii ATCC 22665]